MKDNISTRRRSVSNNGNAVFALNANVISKFETLAEDVFKLVVPNAGKNLSKVNVVLTAPDPVKTIAQSFVTTALKTNYTKIQDTTHTGIPEFKTPGTKSTPESVSIVSVDLSKYHDDHGFSIT